MSIELTNKEWLEDTLSKVKSELKASEERFKNIIEKNIDGIIVVNKKGIVLFINTAGKKLFGYKANKIKNKHFGFPVVEGESSELEIIRDGGLRSVEMSVVETKWEGEDVYLVSMHDITRLKKAEKQILYDAFHSPLTGLPNRAFFLERLGQACDRKKQKDEFSFAVLYLDIDRFKLINDRFGQSAGDKIIILISEKLKKSLNKVNTIAHIGGDDFAILLEDIESLNDVVQYINRFQDEVDSINSIDNNKISLKFKIGICFGSNEYEGPEDIFRDAETAMQRAKKSVADNYHLFNRKMHIQAMKSLKLESEIRKALEENEFKIYYQPIISTANGKIVGFEPLLRWEHPKRGLVPAGEFIEVAHETGLIVPICEMTLETACTQNQIWNSMGFSMHASINISSLQLKQTNFIKGIKRALNRTKLPSSQLILELTEYSIIQNFDTSADILNKLREMGVGISMDDFGTGYSSISYLKRLPINSIKIDRAFVKELPDNPDDSAIVKAIISMAKSLGLKIIGEGVETKEQLEFLRSENCDAVQGYLFSKAVSEKDFTSLLQNDDGFFPDPPGDGN